MVFLRLSLVIRFNVFPSARGRASGHWGVAAIARMALRVPCRDDAFTELTDLPVPPGKT